MINHNVHLSKQEFFLPQKMVVVLIVQFLLTTLSFNGQGLVPCDFSKAGSSLSKWYPDSKSIIYFYSGQQPTINRIDIDGVDIEVLLSQYVGIGHPSVTHDLSLLYQRDLPLTGKKVLVLRTNDNSEIVLTDSTFNSTDGAHHPKDTMIAFAMENEEGNLDIYSLNYKTNKLKRLTLSAAYDYSPHWSPDGTQLIFTSHRDGQPNIYKMDSDGSNKVNLTPGPKEEFSAAWSPDGSRIVFSSRNPTAPNGADPMVKHNSSDLYILSLDNYEIEQITENEDMEVLPAWSKDGNHITYTSCATGNREIYILNINSGETKRLTFTEQK